MAAPEVIVFIDYQNMHLSAHHQWCPIGSPPEDCTLDPTRVAERIVGRRAPGGHIKQIRVYRGRPDPRKQVRMAQASDKQFSTWIADDRVHMLRRPLWYPDDFGKSGCTEQPREKGIDVSLAVDMVRMAIKGEYEVGILFSRDTDMLPALETIIELRAAHVEAAGWEGRTRLRLPGINLWHHTLTEEDFRAVQDTRDY